MRVRLLLRWLRSVHNVLLQVVKYHKVLSDNGKGKQEFEVEFDAQWRFWKVSGYCAIPLRMNLDKTTGEVKLCCLFEV